MTNVAFIVMRAAAFHSELLISKTILIFLAVHYLNTEYEESKVDLRAVLHTLLSILNLSGDSDIDLFLTQIYYLLIQIYCWEEINFSLYFGEAY